MHSVVICSTCRRKGATAPEGAALAEALHGMLADAGDLEVEVSTFACLSACDRPVALACRAPGKATYLFGDVIGPDAARDLLAFLRLYTAAHDGWIDDARPLGALRHRLIGRVPGQVGG